MNDLIRRAGSRCNYPPLLGGLAVIAAAVLVTAAPWLAAHHDRAVQIAREAGAVLLVALGYGIAALAVHLTSPARWVIRPRWPEGPDLAPLDVPERPARPVPYADETAVSMAPPVAWPGSRPESAPAPDLVTDETGILEAAE